MYLHLLNYLQDLHRLHENERGKITFDLKMHKSYDKFAEKTAALFNRQVIIFKSGKQFRIKMPECPVLHMDWDLEPLD